MVITGSLLVDHTPVIVAVPAKSTTGIRVPWPPPGKIRWNSRPTSISRWSTPFHSGASGFEDAAVVRIIAMTTALPTKTVPPRRYSPPSAAASPIR